MAHGFIEFNFFTAIFVPNDSLMGIWQCMILTKWMIILSHNFKMYFKTIRNNKRTSHL